MIRQSEESQLDLDLSVLAERNGAAPEMAIMDRYGIFVFDPEVELLIKQYQENEQQRADYYKKQTFKSTKNQSEQELAYIRQQVFQVTAATARGAKPEPTNQTSYGNILLAAVVFVLILGVGVTRRKKV